MSKRKIEFEITIDANNEMSIEKWNVKDVPQDDLDLYALHSLLSKYGTTEEELQKHRSNETYQKLMKNILEGMYRMTLMMGLSLILYIVTEIHTHEKLEFPLVMMIILTFTLLGFFSGYFKKL